jgi:hypothetical protein
MGKIFAGFIGTVVTVFLTLFIQNWYANNLTQTRFDLKYTSYESAIRLSPEQKKIILADPSATLAFTIYDIENAGTEPLTDQRVRVDIEGYGQGTKILAAGSSSFPGDDKDSVNVQVNGRSAVLDYKILNPGEKHRLWIVDTGYGLSTLIARKPGLRVSSVERSFNNTSFFDDPVNVGFAAVTVGLFIFGFGALMGWLGFADEIKKRGFSPEEVLKLEPERSVPPKA